MADVTAPNLNAPKSASDPNGVNGDGSDLSQAQIDDMSTQVMSVIFMTMLQLMMAETGNS